MRRTAGQLRYLPGGAEGLSEVGRGYSNSEARRTKTEKMPHGDVRLTAMVKAL